MKLPLNWIKRYVDIPTDANDYANKMIATGTAVEGLEPAAMFDKVVVGKVLEVKDHKNSDHLHVCQVDVGNEVLQIVCGAPNVTSNILVPVALVGATMPEGFKIKKGKLRGVESCGMICSGPELGVPTYLYPSVGDDGILIFNEDYALGTDVKEIFGLNDTIIDFDILANRPDCLSVLGIARESSAVLESKLHEPTIKLNSEHGHIADYLSVNVHATDACPRYAAKVVKNIRIAPSPLWLRAYLHNAGIRSINNIVDITNFVMLETGHPMHAFDYSKINGKKIEVNFAEKDSVFVTLDEKKHTLCENDLVICDGKEPVALAGIMGELDSGINDQTQDIVLECAVFDRATIRKTARALGIRTESSGRFEKGVCKATVMQALNRACQLIEELQCGEVVGGSIDVVNADLQTQTITTSIDYIQKRAGISIDIKTATGILERLGFSCASANNTLSVVVPQTRQDIEQEADICEEVLRMYGYDNIPATPLRGATTQGGLNPLMSFRNELTKILRGFGFIETMHYSFTSQKMLERLNLDENDKRMNPIAIMNPLGEDSSLMRTSLVPDMLNAVSLNLNRGNDNVRFYECSKVFFKEPQTSDGLPCEKYSICLGAFGEKEDFYSLRVVCEAILKQLRIAYTIKAQGDSYYHPGRMAQLCYGENNAIQIGEIHPDVAKSFDIQKKIYVAELDLSSLLKSRQHTEEVKDLPKFPAVNRDLAIVFKNDVEIGPVLTAIKNTCSNILESANVFDVYRGKPIDDDSKSVAFAFSFRSADRTLTEDEIQKQMNKILALLKDKFNGYIRE